MKKFWTCILVIILMLLVFRCTMAEVSGICGDNLEWTLTDDDVLTISGTGKMKDYSSVSSAGNQITTAPWKSRPKKVVIEDGVTSIGSHAFYYCKNLTSVTIPNSVTSFEMYAFYGCSSLMSVTIPDSITSINYGAFELCSSLTSISIPVGVTRICTATFNGCSGLTSITIPDSVTIIDSNAFQGCRSLTSITIPNGVASIGKRAFNNCFGLTYITIPNSVIDIAVESFLNCRSLKSISIPDSMSIIRKDVFNGCSSLSSVTIPVSVTSIGDGAFWNCSSLSDVYYGGSEQNWLNMNIGWKNNRLASATIHYNAHDHIWSDPIYTWSTDYSSVTASRTCYNNPNHIETETVKVSTQYIQPTCTQKGKKMYTSDPFENTAFSVQNLEITIDELGHDWADLIFSLGSDGRLTASRVCQRDHNHTESRIITSILFLPTGTLVIEDEAFAGGTFEAVIVPAGCETIYSGAFAGCENLLYVKIPASVTLIMPDAFEGCPNVLIDRSRE